MKASSNAISQTAPPKSGTPTEHTSARGEAEEGAPGRQEDDAPRVLVLLGLDADGNS